MTPVRSPEEPVVIRAVRRVPRDAWIVAALALVVFVLGVVVQHVVYPELSGNRDEVIYSLQARALAHGHLTLERGPDPEFTQPWLSGIRANRVYGVFPVGWPLVLAAGERLLGSMSLVPPLVGALAVVAVYAFAREVARRRDVALVAAALTTLAPIVAVQSALRLSYLFTFVLGLAFATALLHGVRTARRGLLIGAGAALGGVFLTRPFDVVGWSIPFGVYLLVAKRRELGRVFGAFAWVALGMAPFVLAAALYNHAITGYVTRFPITAAEPANDFGFGNRRISPASEYVYWSRRLALETLWDNVRFWPAWAAGGLLGVGAALAGVWIRRRDAITWALVALALVFPFLYLAYWGSWLMAGGAGRIGPMYYIPAYAPTIVMASWALVTLWRRRRVPAVLLGVAIVAVSAGVGVTKLHDEYDLSRGARAQHAAFRAATLEEPALVFVPVNTPETYLGSSVNFALNDRLDGPVLFAADLGTRDIDMVLRHPDRTPYRLTSRLLPGDELFEPTTIVEPLSTITAPVVNVSVHVENPTDAPFVYAYARVGSTTTVRELDAASAKGASYSTEWVLAAPGASAAPEALRIARTESVEIGVAFSRVRGSLESESVAERTGATPVADGHDLAVLQPAVPYRRFWFGRLPWVPADVSQSLTVEWRPAG